MVSRLSQSLSDPYESKSPSRSSSPTPHLSVGAANDSASAPSASAHPPALGSGSASAAAPIPPTAMTHQLLEDIRGGAQLQPARQSQFADLSRTYKDESLVRNWNAVTTAPGGAPDHNYMRPSDNVPSPKELQAVKGTSTHVGDFRGIANQTIPEIVSKVPADAKLREIYPRGGVGKGLEYSWTNHDGSEMNLRIHGPDANHAPSAGAGASASAASAPVSNAGAGWVARVEMSVNRGGKKPEVYVFSSTHNEFYSAKNYTPHEDNIFQHSIAGADDKQKQLASLKRPKSAVLVTPNDTHIPVKMD